MLSMIGSRGPVVTGSTVINVLMMGCVAPIPAVGSESL